jgi:hypothetical protein
MHNHNHHIRYITLFGAVYPLAALYGLLNNLLEIRTDAFKVTE